MKIRIFWRKLTSFVSWVDSLHCIKYFWASLLWWTILEGQITNYVMFLSSRYHYPCPPPSNPSTLEIIFHTKNIQTSMIVTFFELDVIFVQTPWLISPFILTRFTPRASHTPYSSFYSFFSSPSFSITCSTPSPSPTPKKSNVTQNWSIFIKEFSRCSKVKKRFSREILGWEIG